MRRLKWVVWSKLIEPPHSTGVSNDEHHSDAYEDKLHYAQNHDAVRTHRLLLSSGMAINNYQSCNGPDA